MLASTVQFSNNNRDHQTPHTQDKHARPAPRQKKPTPTPANNHHSRRPRLDKGPFPQDPTACPTRHPPEAALPTPTTRTPSTRGKTWTRAVLTGSHEQQAD
ncbi:hypothetical protein Acsp03_72270 [Actinomadura sp. NBRC 104412]|nr:hypothetical protein Acsp03_72270 [Actinomadura sp. NBRC 104412]